MPPVSSDFSSRPFSARDPKPMCIINFHPSSFSLLFPRDFIFARFDVSRCLCFRHRQFYPAFEILFFEIFSPKRARRPHTPRARAETAFANQIYSERILIHISGITYVRLVAGNVDSRLCTQRKFSRNLEVRIYWSSLESYR